MDIDGHPRGADTAREAVPPDRAVPDVTVIVAVYNTMPYLTDCLRSVLEQTIGVDRLELVAVDDGSTDGGGAELDRWAERYPGTMKVLHQANSGGPAGPSNRALELATGRYVYFLGADDTLGAEAMERLVATADELDADIVLGRLVGTGGRVVNQAVYEPGNRDDIDLVNSALPWALSNTKLFRRSLIEEHGIRYPEDLRSGSDQPFTIRAVVAARRIAVRSDYEFYFAARRADSSNITYRTSLSGFARDTAIIMDAAADVITDPVARAKVLHRHFTWELGKLLGKRFLTVDREEQRRVQEGVRKLAETYLTDEIRAGLDVQRRVPLSIAQFGTLDDLIAVARHQAQHGFSPLTFSDDRYYIGYPGFRAGFPDEWFDATSQLRRTAHQDGPARVHWGRASDGRKALVVTWRSLLTDLEPTGPAAVQIALGRRQAEFTARSDGRDGSVITAVLPLDVLVDGTVVKRARRLRLSGSGEDENYSYAVIAADVSAAQRRVHRRGAGLYLISAALDESGRIGVVAVPLTPRRVVGRVLRKLGMRRP
ncbi:glycosyltransferase [Actinoplanes sp. NPDC026623]|uniref:glycosyltransferase family 2 protein n=1 Tax=Actinoplanes sp. NPDC026623 TaxID=3155610 RepID=UPI00340E0941